MLYLCKETVSSDQNLSVLGLKKKICLKVGNYFLVIDIFIKKALFHTLQIRKATLQTMKASAKHPALLLQPPIWIQPLLVRPDVLVHRLLLQLIFLSLLRRHLLQLLNHHVSVKCVGGGVYAITPLTYAFQYCNILDVPSILCMQLSNF